MQPNNDSCCCAGSMTLMLKKITPLADATWKDLNVTSLSRCNVDIVDTVGLFGESLEMNWDYCSFQGQLCVGSSVYPFALWTKEDGNILFCLMFRREDFFCFHKIPENALECVFITKCKTLSESDMNSKCLLVAPNLNNPLAPDSNLVIPALCQPYCPIVILNLLSTLL